MFYEYDDEANVLYIKLREDGIIDRQLETRDGIFIDVDNRGIVLGIEIISPDAGWSMIDISETVKLTKNQIDFINDLKNKFTAQRSWKHLNSSFTTVASSNSNKIKEIA